MGNTLLITKINRNQKTFISTALYSEKHLLELNLEPLEQQSILGNMYVGRVKDVVKNLNAAFIEIAPGKPCYYSLEDYKNPVFVKKINSPRLVQGDEVVVQIIKENIKTKPPKVSTNLNFTGKYLVLTTENRVLGISKKLDTETRKKLKEDLNYILGNKNTEHGTDEKLKEDLINFEKSDISHEYKDSHLDESYQNENPEETLEFGIIVRTNAALASREELQREYERLKQEYEKVQETARHRTCFSCLKERKPEYLESLKQINMEELERIQTDDRGMFGEIRQFLQEYQPEDLAKLSFYEDRLLSLNQLYNLEQRLQEALQEKVWLKSGAYLLIQPTEALTVIDVNTGKSVAKKQVQEHYRKVNLEAAKEIAYQLRLRNISGIIIVDFIDMKSQEAREELMQTLRSCTRADSVPVQVVDMTRLNLVELTRKKVKKSLAEQAAVS